jgi:hypothetical protein
MPTNSTSLRTTSASGNNRRLFIYILIIVSVFLLTSCGSAENTTSPQATPSGQTSPDSTSDRTDPGETTPADVPSDDPDVIQAKWESGSHANTFVVGDDGINSTCARCHAPFNFIPTMEDMPESCATCKFEVDPPPPFTSEAEWIDVECKVCHKFKGSKMEPGIAWLEIAPIEEYADVASVTDLCDKCHIAEEVAGHASAVVIGDHAGYMCTDCHDAHDTSATCSTSGCHENTLEADVPGHDGDHTMVTCVTCHDGGGMEIGILEGGSTWFTFQLDGEGNLVPTASHNIVLAAPCERCHFPENPWELSDSVSIETE